MPITSAQISVGTTRVLLVAADGVAEGIYLHAKHAIHIGGEDVTTSNGYLMDNDDKLTLNNHESPVFGVASAGTGTMQVLVITK